MARFLDEQVFINSAGGADLASEEIDLRFGYGFSIQWNITGTSPVGSAQVQGSNDGVNWTAISTIAVAAVGSFFDNKDAIYYKSIRLFWDYTSGSATINAFLVTKGA